VKIGLSRWGRNVGPGRSRIGCWGRYLGLRGTKYQESPADCLARNLMICTLTKCYSNEEKCDWLCMWHVSGRGKVHTGLWWGDLTDDDHLEDLDVDGIFILKRIFKKWDGELRNGVIWLNIKTGGESCECGDEHSCSIKCGEFLV
jgi:hypothetical protein